MTNYKISDAKMTQKDMDDIEKEIKKHPSMPVHNKQVLRHMLKKEEQFWKWEGRDYLPADEGEPPAGAKWN